MLSARDPKYGVVLVPCPFHGGLEARDVGGRVAVGLVLCHDHQSGHFHPLPGQAGLDPTAPEGECWRVRPLGRSDVWVRIPGLAPEPGDCIGVDLPILASTGVVELESLKGDRVTHVSAVKAIGLQLKTGALDLLVVAVDHAAREVDHERDRTCLDGDDRSQLAPLAHAPYPDAARVHRRVRAEPSDCGGRVCAQGVVVVVEVGPARGTGPPLVIGQYYKAGPRETICKKSQSTIEAGPSLRPRAVQHHNGWMPLLAWRNSERSGERDRAARENDGLAPVGLDSGRDPSPMDRITEHQLPRHSGAVA